MIMLIVCGGVFMWENKKDYQYLNIIGSNKYLAHALTSDNKLVCVHGWSKKDYEVKLGITYNEENSIMSYEQLKNLQNTV